MAFWLAYGDGIEGAATTALQRVAGHLYCVITACGGVGLDHWITLIGVSKPTRKPGLQGRAHRRPKGWRRKLRDYAVTNYVMERTL